MTMAPVTLPTFTQGTELVFTGTFTRQATGLPLDPADISFSFYIETQDPVYFNYDGGVGQITKVSVGVYQINVDTTGLLPDEWEAGLMVCQFAGTAPAQANSSITVRLLLPDIPLVFS